MIDEVPIKDESIRLGQFLKLANLVDSGADAKEPLLQGLVKVNGEVWSARSYDGHPIAAGVEVEVFEIDGVTAVVYPKDKPLTAGPASE